MLVLLPTNNNKLLLQWKGPFSVVEVVNSMDYKVDVNGKTKVYHANLLKLYVEREKDDEQRQQQTTENVAGVAVIEAEDAEKVGAVDDEHLLELGKLVWS